MIILKILGIIIKIFFVIYFCFALAFLTSLVFELFQQKTAIYSTITAYSSEAKQTDSTPFITAFNNPVADGKVAVSWYLFSNGWTQGKCIWIDQIGERKIDDIMSRELDGPRVDIWFHSRNDAKEFGVKHLVLVTLQNCSDTMKGKNGL